MSATARQSSGSSGRSSADGLAARLSDGRAPSSNIAPSSAVVVEGELGRMRTEPHDVDLVFALVVDPGVDQLVAEHASGREEVVVVLERIERLRERPRHLSDAAILLEQIPVGGLAGVQAL